MRRLIWLAVGLATLAGTGVALATGIKGIGIKSVKSATATFSATSVSDSSTSTCTSSDGTIVLTKAEYNGTSSSSEPSLNGPIKLVVRSTINTTKNLGVLHGGLRIDTAAEKHSWAKFTAVYSGGQINGLGAGIAHDPAQHLIANISASFTASGGFTNGKLGDTASGGSAVLLQPGHCNNDSDKKPTQRIEAKGTVSAVSSTSITVAGITCAVPSSLAEKVSKIKQGDRVSITCEQVNNVLTLVKVKKKHSDDDD